MNMKTKKINLVQMSFTGSKILKSIMDNSTPPIDLFVREVIQNSVDAVLPNKDYIRLSFDIGKFSSNDICNKISDLADGIRKNYSKEEYDYIAISDSNTTGLLGKPIKDLNGGPNNLYNLVYDFMNGKSDSTSGGSWGIGKSVYYRYGNGICFYYTRTFEDGRFISKLTGALIQDEYKSNCLLGKDSTGIAFLGDIYNEIAIPIYDEEQIKEFLDIFNLKPYEGDKTGTVVIIPYVNIDEFLIKNVNMEENVRRYWLDDIESCLSMAIQRWYFPRINNESYKGKYLKIAINNNKVELCHFYNQLQKLYNGTLKDSTSVDITGRGFPNEAVLGRFTYKLFSKNDLKMLPPENNPKPKYFVDSNIDCDNEGLLFYTRKPGMILNYDNNQFGKVNVDEDKYLIGIFVLNDDLEVYGENLGQYIRKTEKADHRQWDNADLPEFPELYKKKPYNKICATIKNHLNEVFKHTSAVTLGGSATVLQMKFGKKLLPQFDFGNKPTPIYQTKKDNGNSSVTKKKNVLISFVELSKEGNLVYRLEFFLQPEEKLEFKVKIKAGTKIYSFDEWEKLGFKLPCELSRIDVKELEFNNQKNLCSNTFAIDEDFTKRKKKVLFDNVVYRIRGLATDNKDAYGVVLSNGLEKLSLKAILYLYIKPLDNKYSIGFDYSIGKEVLNEE